MFDFLQAMAISLQRLYLVLPHVAQPPDVLEVEQLLPQAMPQLREITIHAFRGFASVKTKPEYISWEVRAAFCCVSLFLTYSQSRWLFGKELGKPSRHIDMIPGCSERWNGDVCMGCLYFMY